MKWTELLAPFYGIEKQNEGDPEITSLHMDSREVQAGGVFFCIPGYTVDGHDYVPQAIANGAAAIVSERPLEVEVPVAIVKDSKRVMAQIATHFYGEPSNHMHMIGVTGTNGKTTITHLIEKIMQDAGKKTGLVGTMYTKVGDETRETKNTTPESLLLQRLFKEMQDAEVETVAMEVSSHALQTGRVRGTDFDVAVFSNLSPDHLDFHETMEKYKFAKGLLFAQLGNTYNGKVAVLNADDPASKDFEEMTNAQILTYGIDQPADFKAENITIGPKGTSFDVIAFKERYSFSIQLIGKFSVYNMLAAVATAYASGVSFEAIQKSLESVEGVAGRFEPVKVEAPYTVIVDYAHTPDSLENVLHTVNEFAEGKVSVVVGCGGDRDKTKRPIMAEIATRLADEAIFTSDNPRSEDPMQILKDMEAGVTKENYTIIEDRKEAIEYAVNEAQEKEIIVIAGKGHETYQIFPDRTIDFDDREVAAEAMKRKG
jgi:UDP-N-acetylmuramoyl-L-alanyl-D-glutamate--2,6-diaminopimelate ligase